MNVAHGELDVDQSPLTGESLLIPKSAESGQSGVILLLLPSVSLFSFPPHSLMYHFSDLMYRYLEDLL